MRRSRVLPAIATLAVVAAPLVSRPADGQAVAIQMTVPECAPRKENVAVYATVTPDVPGNEVRTYFHRRDYGDLYYLVMHPMGNGRYWAVLPKPQEQNESVEFHIHVRSADDQALESSPSMTIPVTSDCKVELTDEQRDAAQKLRVGDTRPDQRGRAVAWFLCDGIVERIDLDLQVRPDLFCAVPPGPVPIVAEGKSGVISGEDPPDVSPARP